MLSPHGSLSSSPPPYLDPAFSNLHILSESDDDATDCEGNDDRTYIDNDNVQHFCTNIMTNLAEDNDKENYRNQEDTIEQVPLTPIFQDICPLSPMLPSYDNIPSPALIPSLPTPVPSRKVRSTKTVTEQPAKKIKKISKFALSFNWNKSEFRHFSTIENNNYTEQPHVHIHTLIIFHPMPIISDITEKTNLYSVQETGKSIMVTAQDLIRLCTV